MNDLFEIGPGLTSQLGPFRTGRRDHPKVRKVPWKGGGVPGGGQAHAGHANWVSTITPMALKPAPMVLKPSEWASLVGPHNPTLRKYKGKLRYGRNGIPHVAGRGGLPDGKQKPGLSGNPYNEEYGTGFRRELYPPRRCGGGGGNYGDIPPGESDDEDDKKKKPKDGDLMNDYECDQNEVVGPIGPVFEYEHLVNLEGRGAEQIQEFTAGVTQKIVGERPWELRTQSTAAYGQPGEYEVVPNKSGQYNTYINAINEAHGVDQGIQNSQLSNLDPGQADIHQSKINTLRQESNALLKKGIPAGDPRVTKIGNEIANVAAKSYGDGTAKLEANLKKMNAREAQSWSKRDLRFGRVGGGLITRRTGEGSKIKGTGDGNFQDRI